MHARTKPCISRHRANAYTRAHLLERSTRSTLGLCRQKRVYFYMDPSTCTGQCQVIYNSLACLPTSILYVRIALPSSERARTIMHKPPIIRAVGAALWSAITRASRASMNAFSVLTFQMPVEDFEFARTSQGTDQVHYPALSQEWRTHGLARALISPNPVTPLASITQIHVRACTHFHATTQGHSLD